MTFCHPYLTYKCKCLAANTRPPTETENTDIPCANVPAIMPVCTHGLKLNLPMLIHLPQSYSLTKVSAIVYKAGYHRSNILLYEVFVTFISVVLDTGKLPCILLKCRHKVISTTTPLKNSHGKSTKVGTRLHDILHLKGKGYHESIISEGYNKVV